MFKQAPKFLPNQTSILPNNTNLPSSIFLFPVSFNEIIITFASISNSHAIGSDGIVPMLVKANVVHISQQLVYIVNLSFSQGVFPKSLKNAILDPVNKGRSHMNPGIYRPISVLKIFSKLFEKLFHSGLRSFFDNNNALHSTQFGFRKNRSTTTAIANVLASLNDKCKNNNKCAFVLLDLKKAFDFINHNLLLVKLKHYGVKGLPILWLNSYLTNRL